MTSSISSAVDTPGPKRIQLSRKKGWRKPVLAAVVSRPSYFGNPFIVGETTPAEWEAPFGGVRVLDRAHAVQLLREYLAWRKAQGPAWFRTKPGPKFPWESQIRQLLRGRDLCCWCPLSEPCHADLLIEIAAEPGPARAADPEYAGPWHNVTAVDITPEGDPDLDLEITVQHLLDCPEYDDRPDCDLGMEVNANGHERIGLAAVGSYRARYVERTVLADRYTERIGSVEVEPLTDQGMDPA